MSQAIFYPWIDIQDEAWLNPIVAKVDRLGGVHAAFSRAAL